MESLIEKDLIDAAKSIPRPFKLGAYLKEATPRVLEKILHSESAEAMRSILDNLDNVDNMQRLIAAMKGPLKEEAAVMETTAKAYAADAAKHAPAGKEKASEKRGKISLPYALRRSLAPRGAEVYHMNLTLSPNLEAGLDAVGRLSKALGGARLAKTEVIRAACRLALELDPDLSGVTDEYDLLMRLRVKAGLSGARKAGPSRWQLLEERARLKLGDAAPIFYKYKKEGGVKS